MSVDQFLSRSAKTFPRSSPVLAPSFKNEDFSTLGCIVNKIRCEIACLKLNQKNVCEEPVKFNMFSFVLKDALAIQVVVARIYYFQIQAFAKSYADRVVAEAFLDVLAENSGKGIH